MFRCCVPGCKESGTASKICHCFPNPKHDRKRFNEWLFHIGGDVISLDNSFIFKYRRVCRSHFEEKYHCRYNRLSNIAVPTLNLPRKYSAVQKSGPENCEAIKNTTKAEMSTDAYRKCCVCGATPIQLGWNSFHRFPKPGKTNIGRAQAWAKYCYPDQDLTSVEDLTKLYQNNKVLCKRHFEDYCFTDTSKTRLLKFSLPTVRNYKVNTAPPPDKQKKAEPQQTSFQVINQRIPIKPNSIHGTGLNVILMKPNPIQGTGLNFIPIKPKPSNVEPTKKEEELNYLEEIFPECPSPSHSDVPEPEPDPGPFSWQKSIPISVEKDELFSHYLDDKVNLVGGDENKSNNLNTVTNTSSKDKQNEDEGKYVSEKHSDFSCDHCLGEIIGFRYTCIQCENFDLCRACESRLVHPHHYVLRVPAPRPFNEIRSVIAAIRVKLKILEDSFRQQSDDWIDVEIKKEEDPLEEETSVPPAESVRDPLEEYVVPDADPEIYEAKQQESRLQTSSKAIQNINNLVRNSTSDVSGVSENVVVLQQDASHSDVIFLQQDADISNTESDVVFIQDSSNNDVIFLQQNTSSNTDVVFLEDISGAIVLQEDTTDSTEVVVLQQNASASNNNLIFSEQHTSDANIETLREDNILKNNEDPYKYTTVANTNDKVIQGSDASNTSEMFEEYLDEVWLDGSVLAKGNIKENVPETTNVINEHERGRRKRKRKC